jgi:deoxyribonuclease (pyrimidine dimer)
MTRINVGIAPAELPNKLLIAEHREITRIPNAIKTGRAKIKDIPQEFTLGAGHVKFFYTRLLFLKKRYSELYRECKAREFQVTDKSDSFLNLPEELTIDYEPTDKDRQLLIERIQSKGFFLRVLNV